MSEDDDDGDDRDREPPTYSRMGNGRVRRYRTLRRATIRTRRWRMQVPIAEVLGQVLRDHGLTDEARKQAVCLFWFEIAGDRIASKTLPVAFADGVLSIEASNSSWVHEMQFHRTAVIRNINKWVETQQVWLGPPPFVHELRVVLAARKRELLVDRGLVESLRRRRVERERRRVPVIVPQLPSNVERDAIRAETSHIDDPALRAEIEAVRLKWNR